MEGQGLGSMVGGWEALKKAVLTEPEPFGAMYLHNEFRDSQVVSTEISQVESALNMLSML